jgi:endosialidase-like protein
MSGRDFGLRVSMILSVALFAHSLQAAEPEQPAAPALVTTAMPFTGITPCRIVDTRDATKPPGYGPPSMVTGQPRPFGLTGQCGIPIGARAVSLNVTVVSPQKVGYLLLYPKGGAQPTVSTLNFVQNQTVANAAIVPLGTDGGVTAAVALSDADLIIDTNGYFGASPGNDNDVFVGLGTGNPALTPFADTGFGNYALALDPGPMAHTAVGYGALQFSVANEVEAEAGSAAAGYAALGLTSTGYYNTGFGSFAGNQAGTGFVNYAVGYHSLLQATNGYGEVAIGNYALDNLVTDPTNPNYMSHNVAIGYGAGENLVDQRGTVFIGTSGVNDWFLTRIGAQGVHTSTYVAGVWGASIGTSSALLLVDPTGQLGTIVSSARYKEGVRDMADQSEALSRLRPVTFRYHDQERLQYGLIAEEVDEVLPDLVVCDGHGDPEAVQYHELPALLLNEMEKQERRLDAAERARDARQTEIAAGEAELRRHELRLEELRVRIAKLERKAGER